MTLTIGKADLERKMKQAQGFLSKKQQVRVSLALRGRQRSNPERGVEFLTELFDEHLSEHGKLANRPNPSNLSLSINPKK